MTLQELQARTDQFVATWTNTKVDIDWGFPKANPFQCWDLAGKFAKDVVGCPDFPTRPGGNGGAIDCYRFFLAPLPSYFTRFAVNTATPRKGDVIIWNENVGSGDGHVSIFLYEIPSGFVSFDQNWPVGSAPKLVSHNYNNVVGFLRPIVEEDVTIPDADNYYWRYGQDLAMKLRGRQLSREEFRLYLVGKTDLRAIEILSDDPEAATVEHAQEVGTVAIRDNWPGQIYGLQDQVKDLGAQVSELQKRPTQQALSDLQSKYDTLEKSTQKVVDNVVIPPKPETAPATHEPDFITKILAKVLPFLK